MPFSQIEPQVGYQPITANETIANHALGTIVRASDPLYGVGEFIYLKGVASTTVGRAVYYNLVDGSTALSTAGANGHLAIAMSACVANQFGWYQISGCAIAVTPNAVVSGALVYVIAGGLDDAVTATDLVNNALFASANGTPAANFALVNIDRPFVGV
jgi:hypothetical protein